MTNLLCNVTNCTNNKDHLCSLNNITIDLGGSHSNSGAFCSSFQNSDGTYTNIINTTIEGNPNMEVYCTAYDCIHNGSDYCKASNIVVNGTGAVRNSQTICSMFDCG